MCQGLNSLYWDKLIPPLIGILIMGPYKPLRNWVDFSHPLLYGNNGSWSTLAHMTLTKHWRSPPQNKAQNSNQKIPKEGSFGFQACMFIQSILYIELSIYIYILCIYIYIPYLDIYLFVYFDYNYIIYMYINIYIFKDLLTRHLN